MTYDIMEEETYQPSEIEYIETDSDSDIHTRKIFSNKVKLSLAGLAIIAAGIGYKVLDDLNKSTSAAGAGYTGLRNHVGEQFEQIADDLAKKLDEEFQK